MVTSAETTEVPVDKPAKPVDHVFESIVRNHPEALHPSCADETVHALT